MNEIYNKNLISNSRELRKNMTPQEKKLWYNFLKKQDFTVHRQKVLRNYIVDFYLPSKKIVIEIDGSQHFEFENRIEDKERDNVLNKLGIIVLRYTNFEVDRDFENVCKDILKNLG